MLAAGHVLLPCFSRKGTQRTVRISLKLTEAKIHPLPSSAECKQEVSVLVETSFYLLFFLSSTYAGLYCIVYLFHVL